MSKLIIIRGNSGSGKSTLAKKLREEVGKGKKIAIVEQDYLRRFILKEKEGESENNVDLIKLTTLFAMERGYDVILEGILYSKRYKEIITDLMQKSTENYVYYMDISFDETLKRHQTKVNAYEFGEKEMKEWYKERDQLKVGGEKIISENQSINQSVQMIIEDSGL